MWLYSKPRVGSQTIKELVAQEGQDCSGAAMRRIVKGYGVEVGDVEGEVNKHAEMLWERGIGVVPFWDKRYPQKLAQIHGSPAFLFYVGKWHLSAFSKTVAIVGTRRASDYGVNVAKDIASALSKYEIGVVSGLAIGIDAEVHRSCFTRSRQCIPVAVLPGGPSAGYPPSNHALYRSIVESGLVLSEFLPGVSIRPEMFASRNRIVAGLADLIVVIEAPTKSGALITADLGLQNGREVGAVPGSIFSSCSDGCNELLFQGAHVIRSAKDILELLSFRAFDDVCDKRPNQYMMKRIGERLGVDVDTMEKVYERGCNGILGLMDMVKICELTENDLRKVLTMLELEGILRLVPGDKVKFCF